MLESNALGNRNLNQARGMEKDKLLSAHVKVKLKLAVAVLTLNKPLNKKHKLRFNA